MLHKIFRPTLLISTLLLALAACGGGGSGSTASATSSSASSTNSSASSSSTSSSGIAAVQSTPAGGFAAPTAGGLPVYDNNGAIIGSTLADARVKYAKTFEEINAIVAAARINDAGTKVTAGAYPLLIVYSGNEDALIATIVKDHTPDAAGNCAITHWGDTYREVPLKDFTKGITLIGTNGSSANFGITIVNSGNVIIRNMKIGALGGANSDADMIRIDNSPNVWVDHNELFAVNKECNGSPDGDLTFESALDIKKGAHNITISYNYIHDSKKVGLDGSSSSDIAGGREITFHHNVYKNVNGRLPLQRGGWTHMYNNFYDTITESGINVRTGGLALIENNWFQNAANPVTCRFDVVNCGKWELRGNNTSSAADNATYNISWTDSGGGANADAWTSTATTADSATLASKITYAYTPASAQCVKDHLAKVAGVGKGFAALSCN